MRFIRFLGCLKIYIPVVRVSEVYSGCKKINTWDIRGLEGFQQRLLTYNTLVVRGLEGFQDGL
jgi:hypothetical protein